ncbi:bifunctional 4-hydroxy-2-oxoglutarate aldolase/2-dehydro-3-deoxy-phosphogluconate aldolase [Natronospirillum operosum]|uniref:2-dehydro-3-deoxy-phosphogluconate aldolase n=1 Tax=Natronospirillum operosum TaxID=2759953 RepID=A0A4Z0WGD9_9GAMM|nr:bifunctional 4-hydroxy-2-oxoglutarate aldolase/2-dehydro-3-deoxy-phosphogluconate aldolase [Natronospirillum operosum]TGG93500.1 bifunctional 4-hydroxy-2-oxoglutarate aldolase/2-dehydro-3-deoxy-phosphogluconate aldolase [Natronospirillum operosum]
MSDSERMEVLLQKANPVMPVLAIDDLRDAIPLAQALAAGGMTVLEVTLRTPAALDAIREMKQIPGLTIGAGTVMTPRQLEQLQAVNADFAVSPGATDTLLKAGQDIELPFLPAVGTASEIMRGVEYGYRHFKFFPATVMGGTAALKAFAGPFPELKFCPTGGVNPQNMDDFLELPNVLCVGGSWLAPKTHIQDQDWPAITALAQQVD